MNQHFEKYLNFKKLLIERMPKVVVEMGVADGKNTRYLMDIRPQIGFKLYSISDAHMDEGALQIGPDGSNKTRFEWINDLSYRALKRFKDGEIDFLFIDTDHNYHTMKLELEAAKNKMSVNGIIVMHDTVSFRKKTGKAFIYGTGDPYPIKEVNQYEEKGLGMTDAIWDFLKENPDFTVLKEDLNSHGAMAIKKFDMAEVACA